MRIERLLAIAFVIIWAVILWAAVLTYKNSQKIIQSGKDLAEANRILYQIESLSREITAIESYTRAYIITADSNFSFNSAKIFDSAYARVNMLRDLLSKSPDQLNRLDSALRIGKVNSQRNFYLRSLIKEGKKEEAVKVVQSGVVIKATAQLLSILFEMKLEEERRLVKMQSSFQEEQQFFFTVFVVRLILIPLILITIYYITVYSIRSFRKTELRLDETTKLLSGLIKYAPTTIAMYDTEGKLILANEEAVKPFGLSSEEIKGKTVFEFLPLQDAERIKKENEEVVKTNTRIETETTILINGKQQNFLNIRFPLHDHKGKTKYIGTIGLNITELKNKETVILQLNTDLENRIKELEEANEELKNFTSTIAHDLRTPLRAISSFSNILLKEHTGVISAEAKRLLVILDQNAHSMSRQIDDLLSYAGIGRTKLLLVETDLIALAQKVVDKFTHANPKANLSVTFGPPYTVKCDPLLMKQALDNLLSNSFKYSSRSSNPKIHFDWYTQNDEVVFFLKDNGVGFDMRYSGKLFSMFNRLHADEQFEGTGMGLAIVQRIITRHGGKVWAEGKIGEGATFYFSLPLTHK